MRDFNDADRARKSGRTKIQENPGGLSAEALSALENAVRTSLKEGYLSCLVAWSIAEKYRVPRIAVGEIADRLGIRITDCQFGCFRVDKTPYDESSRKNIDNRAVAVLESLKGKGRLGCDEVFGLARRHKIRPAALAGAMNAAGLKISDCQLGCF